MRLISPLLFALACANAAVGETTYDCSFSLSDGEVGMLTARQLDVAYAEGSGEAAVNSAVIMEFVGKPLMARVVKESAAQLVLSWEINAKNSANQYARVKYSLNIRNAGAKATLNIKPLDYSNSWRNEGTCKKGKS